MWMKRSGLASRIASKTLLADPVSAQAENAMRNFHGPSPNVRNRPLMGVPPRGSTRYSYAVTGSRPVRSNAAIPLGSETDSKGRSRVAPAASARASWRRTGMPPRATRALTTAP